jgi:hypothetical protein
MNPNNPEIPFGHASIFFDDNYHVSFNDKIFSKTQNRWIAIYTYENKSVRELNSPKYNFEITHVAVPNNRIAETPKQPIRQPIYNLFKNTVLSSGDIIVTSCCGEVFVSDAYNGFSVVRYEEATGCVITNIKEKKEKNKTLLPRFPNSKPYPFGY